MPPVPIVPSACLYDLPSAAPEGWGAAGPPYGALGAAALDDAVAALATPCDPRLGAVGAGCGARAGARRGGLGEASLRLGGGLVAAALAAANPVGSPYMADGESFWAWPLERVWRGAPEFGGARPDPSAVGPADPFPADAKFVPDAEPGAGPAGPSLNTIVALVATNAALAPAELRRVAAMAQDGLSRAVRRRIRRLTGTRCSRWRPARSSRRRRLGPPGRA